MPDNHPNPAPRNRLTWPATPTPDEPVPPRGTSPTGRASRRTVLMRGAHLWALSCLSTLPGVPRDSRFDSGPASVRNTGREHLRTPARLTELRQLAQQAPIDVLHANWLAFVDDFARVYPQDPVLPRGIARLANHVLTQPALADRRTLATSLAQVVELGEPSLRVALAAHARALRRIG